MAWMGQFWQDELSRERDEARARVHELEDQTTRQLQQQKVEALRRTDYDSVSTDAYVQTRFPSP